MKQLKRLLKQGKGFTLIELMISIAFTLFFGSIAVVTLHFLIPFIIKNW